MRMLGNGTVGLKVIGFVAGLLLVPRVAFGQECQINSDCGHGFQCIHDSAGTSAVTGVGGSTMPECGDGICEGGSEDIESCPDDCDTIQYCAPAECSSDSDCAEGYECGPEVGSNSGSTSVGGTGGSVCGDGICSFDESNASCPDDCRVYRLCQVAQMECMLDTDCPDGFYCYMESVDTGSNSSSASNDVSSVDTGGGSDGTDGEDGGSTSGGEQIVFIAGVCLPENSEASTSQGNSSTDAGQAASGSGGSGTDGEGGGVSNDSAANANATGSGEASGSDSGGSSAGGASGSGGGDGGEEGGCACAAAGAPSGTSWLVLIGLVGLAGAVRRRRAAVGHW